MTDALDRLRQKFIAYRDAPMRGGSKREVTTIRKTLNVVVCAIDAEIAALARPDAPSDIYSIARWYFPESEERQARCRAALALLAASPTDQEP